MTQHKIQQIFFFGLLTIVGGLAVFMFLPFIGTVVLAGAFGVILNPLYKRLLRLFKGIESLAALVTMAIGAIILLVPIILFGLRIFKESADLYVQLSSNPDWISHFTNDILLSEVNRILPGVEININDILRQGVSLLTGNLGSIFAGTLESIVHAFVFTISLFYILKDGGDFRKAMVHISPLRNVHDKEIYDRLTTATRSILMGSLLVAIVQGILAGIGLAIFGVPNATLWGSVSAIFSLIPGIGTSVIWVPAIVYAYVSMSPMMALGLAIWAVTVVGLIDNILSPILIGRKVRIHPFFVLMSVVSGLAFFGPAGFIYGPLLLSLLFALLDIYRSLVLKERLVKPLESGNVATPQDPAL